MGPDNLIRFAYRISDVETDEARALVQQVLRTVVETLPDGPFPGEAVETLEHALRAHNLVTEYRTFGGDAVGWHTVLLTVHPHDPIHNRRRDRRHVFVSLHSQAATSETAHNTLLKGARRLLEG